MASFVLDEEGKPKGESAGHYRIKLSVAGAPADTYAVTYELDSTYYDPIRESRDSQAAFDEEITSYGDFDVKAKIRARGSAIRVRRQLYDALLESHGNDTRPEVIEALRVIKEN